MDTGPDLSAAAVAAALRDAGVATDDTVEVTRLSGGYSWITLRVESGGGAVIVRIAPEGGTVEPYDPRAEARILTAVAGVVPAPSVVAVSATDDNPIGRPFGVHTLCPGEVVRRPENLGPYTDAFADALAAIHRDGDVDALGGGVTVATSYAVELDRVADAFAQTWAHPGWIVALRRLRAELPTSTAPGVVLHGDYRPANILWTGPGRIGGVLDWERARVGDPLADVAFTQHLAGWAALDGDVLDRYLSASGTEPDVERLGYARRFERVRSHLSGSAGLRAFVDGRADDDRLVAVGEAGEVGMWGLVDWLDRDLPPLEADIVERALAHGGYPVDADVAGRVVDEDLAGHLRGWTDRDDADSASSLDALVRWARFGEFVRIDRVDVASAASTWDAAHADLCRAAATAGPEIVPALRALGTRYTQRPTRFPRMEWR